MYSCQNQIGSYLNYLIEKKYIDKAVWESNVGNKVHYIDGNLDFDSMRWLYSAGDCYLSPYMGEGFNLPALEAMACGTPLLVTRGGSTDDFVHPDCALFLDAKMDDAPDPGGKWLASSHEDLTRLMLAMAEGRDGGITMAAQTMGPEHVQKNFTWEIATRKLLDALRRIAATNI
jgi:glycosyltransferase involved in cell wall biosynthesis